MRVLKTVLASLVLLLTAAALSSLCIAQTASTGALAGTVTDPTGAVVAGANVTATNEATAESRSVVSGSDGTYRKLKSSGKTFSLKLGR